MQRFFSSFLLCLALLIGTARAQSVNTYLTHRWMYAGESVSVVVTVSGEVLRGMPTFPEIPGFDKGNQQMRVESYGAGRTAIYEQRYTANSVGTHWVPAVVIPWLGEDLTMSPGVVTVRTGRLSPNRSYTPAPLAAELRWEHQRSALLQGQIQQSTLVLSLPSSQESNLIWRLGGIAELADSLKRSAFSAYLIKDSVLAAPPSRVEVGRLQVPLYRIWSRGPIVGLQQLPALPLRVERLWRPRQVTRGAGGSGRWQESSLEVPVSTWNVLPSPLGERIPVGPLQVAASWNDSGALRTGEPYALRVEIRGYVSMAQVPAPRLAVPEGLVMQGPSVTVSYTLVNDSLIGVKTFRYLLYAARAGQYPLPELAVSWQTQGQAGVDTATVLLPQLQVTGPDIPQLAQLQQLQQFYPRGLASAGGEPLRDPIPPRSLLYGLLPLLAALTVWTGVRFRQAKVAAQRAQLRGRRRRRVGLRE